MLINELVSNSLKHAFPGDRCGTIRVELRADGPRYRLSVSDNGIGFPEDLDFRRAESFGLQLVGILSDQLEAATEVRRQGGTEFAFTFFPVEYPVRQ